jgi:hypothetical protein
VMYVMARRAPPCLRLVNASAPFINARPRARHDRASPHGRAVNESGFQLAWKTLGQERCHRENVRKSQCNCS